MQTVLVRLHFSSSTFNHLNQTHLPQLSTLTKCFLILEGLSFSDKW